MLSFRRLVFLPLLVLIGLGGCAGAARRTLDTDAVMKSVAVVSLLQEDVPVQKIGLTVFNNDQRTVPMKGELNKVATAVVESRLKLARPTWVVKPSNADGAKLSQKFGSAGISWSSHTGTIKSDLAALASAAGVDALFVVIDTALENERGKGVGIVLRALPGMEPSALVHANVLVVLVDREGNEITNRIGSGSTSTKASELGLTVDLSSVGQPEVQKALQAQWRAKLSANTAVAMERMGY